MPHSSRVSRRLFLAAPGAWIAGRIAAAEAQLPPQDPGLNRHALLKRRFYGAAVDNLVLRSDRAFMAHVSAECGVITGESAFKWGEIHPAPNRFDFTNADKLMSFAERHDLQARGHTLLWHQQNPKWLEQQLNPGNAERLLSQHIATVCRHFRHRLTHWDVVNEVLWPADGQRWGLRNSLWHRALGPRMLDVAFEACAEADPGATRFINDFGMEYTWPDNEKKRRAMLELLSDLKARNVPVQGVGVQAHLEAGADNALNQNVLAKFCDDVASLGLQIVITEFDVRDNHIRANLEERDAAVAAHGRAFLDAMLASPAVLGVLSWGLSDRRTWLNDDLPRKDGLPQRPLPLDTEMNRKPLWAAMAASFDAAPPRA